MSVGLNIPSRWDPKLEIEVLGYWKTNKIYEKWRLSMKGKPEYRFLEGPPYTTGAPHIGHAWNRSLKDTVLRYRAKKGYHVWVQSGFDMHGLPIEEKIEKKLGITKKDIDKLGVKKFIKECKDFAYGSMLNFYKLYERMAHWQDIDNPYLPISNEYIEKVWKLIKKAEEKGLLYEGEKVVHWCPRCRVVLAKHEIELAYLDSSKYKPAIDPSIYVKLRLKERPNTYLIIWTTTPWTLLFNLGVMVNPNATYVLVEVPKYYVSELDLDEENKLVKHQRKSEENTKEYWILAKDLLDKLMEKFGIREYRIVKEFLGKELEGLEYYPPFYNEIKEYLEKLKEKYPNILKVWLSEEYVSLEEGTGLVHSAPGCGPEDYEVGKKYGVDPFNTVDEDGIIQKLPIFTGWKAKFDDLKFVNKLLEKKMLLHFEWYEHDYPMCWRCSTRVIFRTTKQWFFDIQKIKPELLEDLEEVRFIPESVKLAMKNVFLAAPDWVISRQRYWGIPIPIWKCKNNHMLVIDSVKELEKLTGKEFKTIYVLVKKSEYAEELFSEYYDFKEKVSYTSYEEFLENLDKLKDKTLVLLTELPEEFFKELENKGYFYVRSYGYYDYELVRVYNYDLHKPWIDDVKFSCPVCGEVMSRIPDILDVWIDSGSAPFASREKEVFPVDFIVEGRDQLRGWFYSLAILGKIYFGKIPYRNVYTHGYVLDSKGMKMSKSLGNIVDPMDAMEKYGADAFRYYEVSSTAPFEDQLFNWDDLKAKFSNLNVLWNTHRYLIEQSKYYNINPAKLSIEELKLKLEDKYMLSVLNRTIKEVTEAYENYELYLVPRLLERLWLELSKTYIKLVRERLAEGSENDRKTVLYVIYETLFKTINMFSTVAPFITEKVFLNLKEAFELKGESVHLLSWPEYKEDFIDKDLEETFEVFKNVLEAGLRLRNRIRRSVRWPLKNVKVFYKGKLIEKEEVKRLLMKALNVLNVEIVEEIPREVNIKVALNFKNLEEKGVDIVRVAAELSKINSREIYEKLLSQGKVDIAGYSLGWQDFILSFESKDEKYGVEPFYKGVLVVDLEVSEEVLIEGYSRELIRKIQNFRKELGLKKDQRVKLYVLVPVEILGYLTEKIDKIKENVGASELTISNIEPENVYENIKEIELKDKKAKLFLSIV